MRTKRRSIVTKQGNSSKILLTSKLSLVLVGILIILQIFTAVQTSSSGAVLANLEKKELELIKQNQELSNAVIDNNSLLNIREKSEELGYSSPQETFYITDQDTVALLKCAYVE